MLHDHRHMTIVNRNSSLTGGGTTQYGCFDRLMLRLAQHERMLKTAFPPFTQRKTPQAGEFASCGISQRSNS